MNKLIKLSDTHYIVIDDSEIQENDWYWTPIKRSIEQCVKKLLVIKGGQNDVEQLKITHSTQPELLGDGWMQSVTPLLLSEVEEAINGYGVITLSNEHQKLEQKTGRTLEGSICSKYGYMAGFKAHQELVKDKLLINDKDLFDFLYFARTHSQYSDGAIVKEFIDKFLKKQTEWNIEFDKQGKLKLI